jgi:LacI family transcriptional regulator
VKEVRLTDLAKMAGVSLTTVSRVVNQSGYVAEDVRRRVEQAIEQTGYVHTARKASVRRDKLIGIITLNSPLNPYFAQMVYALQRQAENSGYYGLQVTAAKLDNETLASHAERLASIGVCGVIVCSFNDKSLDNAARAVLHCCGIPVVFLERTSGCFGFNRVLVDNELGTYSATQYLLRRGHTHLAYISLEKQTEVELSRSNGFLKAIENDGNSEVRHQTVQCKDATPKAAVEAMKAAYQKDPVLTGVVAWNDVYAAGVLHYFEQIGKRVPDDAEIVGHDNILAQHLSPPISSVEMPINEIAAAAVEIIDKCQNASASPSPRTITLEPKLVIRNGE